MSKNLFIHLSRCQHQNLSFCLVTLNKATLEQQCIVGKNKTRLKKKVPLTVLQCLQDVRTVQNTRKPTDGDVC